MRVLNAAETAAALPYAQLVPAIGQAGREVAAGEINAPERLVVAIDARSVLLCMPALGSDLGVTKLITVHNDNARHGLPAIQGEVTVFDVAHRPASECANADVVIALTTSRTAVIPQ
jgi:1-piperideine-2-carboxylate/1-pyrroline-2-carboxylate reductase [NAD(P)H]